MKRFISIFLTVTLLVTCVFVGTPSTYAYTKAGESRAIAIVFDNSGSMYMNGEKAWCRATYAMEVFASMLNDGDTLQIYPMNPIKVGDKEYTMNKPLEIRDTSQAATIRDIYTETALGTPIESIDCAVDGIKSVKADKKYMVVLTDGGKFFKNGVELSEGETKSELDKRIKANSGKSLTVMYLGISDEACIPDTKQSEHFVKKQAVNTSDVLSTLTDMCNLIFGRDTLPESHCSANSLDFDISMSKLIVFVQGKNISDLKITPESGDFEGKVDKSQQTKYSTKGAENYKSVADTSLQGMIVTYEDCAAGKYDIQYEGTADSVEVYYEPDADLEFIFTDSKGNNVDLNSLYEGEYKVSFGMKDAKTGELISSELLGNPHYEGSYTINGEKTKFTADGYSGEEVVKLEMNDTFKADLTATYLGGYTISKNSSDFGWPKGGVKVVAPPLGEFKAELNIPQDYILIKDLDKSEEMVVDLTFDGEKLTEDEFDAVELNVDCDGLSYAVVADKKNSQYVIKLDPSQSVEEGDYDISVEANYLDKAERSAQASDSSEVTLSNTPLWLKWLVRIGLLLLLALIAWLIAHKKAMPTHANTSRKLSSMNYDGEDVTNAATFDAQIKKRSASVKGKYGGKNFGLSMDVTPAKDSYLYKPSKSRSVEVKPNSVKKTGPVKIEEAMIGSVKYVLDEDTGKLAPAIANQKPFKLKNGDRVKYSGIINDAGVDKDFEVVSKLDFKKKK